MEFLESNAFRWFVFAMGPLAVCGAFAFRQICMLDHAEWADAERPEMRPSHYGNLLREWRDCRWIAVFLFAGAGFLLAGGTAARLWQFGGRVAVPAGLLVGCVYYILLLANLDRLRIPDAPRDIRDRTRKSA
ncbi:MAG: hypothetical protein Greene041619_759 [Candidatus Peregrinibacteria bacterium Greene0416_19]|nr:MAG: hypothetical protein Greene041619_759 [Candidatus Peregrinibacteria bacterium Greene0416_19]